MNLIQNISLTLKTWVFKNKILKFNTRFAKEPLACFYCPEMCRFSCPVAETLRDNTVTPRGKMSLLHLMERGYEASQIAGSDENYEWTLEQCTGCGRCTEYCVYENDVASSLRHARTDYFKKTGNNSVLLPALDHLSGSILLCESGRKSWWEKRQDLLAALGVQSVSELQLPHREWGWGKLSKDQARNIGEAFKDCKQIWVESPEVAWFLVKGLKEEEKTLHAQVNLVWSKFFTQFVGLEFASDIVTHESYHLTRSLPWVDSTVPIYERGIMPFHHGRNVIDCGGEGYYQEAHPQNARAMGERFLFDLKKDGREIKKIVCQSYACVSHLKKITQIPVTYWLDEMKGSST